jgi:2-amino-4-hydroxy-6-hydroxymethyldihydropteridine diphosphokinase
VYLGLGSNLGDRLAFLSQAVERLQTIPDTSMERLSSVYETEPVGFKDQPDFLNLTAHLTTMLPPAALFSETKKIEKGLGRRSELRWHPREIDIDILLYDDLIFRSQHLFIPHPEMTRRRFVLLPLSEIASSVIHPVEKIDVRGLLAHCTDQSRVTRTDHRLANYQEHHEPR